MGAIFTIGIGAGLASVAGLRAYLPLALAGVFALLGLFELYLPYGVLGSWRVVGVLLVLAVVEGVMDKFPASRRAVAVVQTPARIAAGAALFAVAVGAGLTVEAIPELAAGGAISGAVSVLKTVLRPASGASADTPTGVSEAFLSAVEDAAALLGGVVSVFVPFVAVALVAFVLFFFYRIRKRRSRKYRGLRILGD